MCYSTVQYIKFAFHSPIHPLDDDFLSLGNKRLLNLSNKSILNGNKF